jgi:hypothetical protein
MSLPSRLLGANPSIQVSTLLSGSLATPSAKQSFIPLTNFDSIASFNLSTTTASVTFSDIPQIYKDLHLRVTARNSGSGTGTNIALIMRFNGDSTINYSRFAIYGNGSTVSVSNTATDSRVLIDNTLVGGGSAAGYFGGYIIDIHDYASTTIKKSVRSISGADNNTNRLTAIYGNLWNDTSAISSIVITPESDSFASGCTFSLYGITGE